MAKILVTGGTGLIGKHLCERLQAKGYDVAILSRGKQKVPGIQTYIWKPEKNEVDKKAIETADYIIHLAGADIGTKRWTAKRKQMIVDSRIKTGDLIYNKTKEQRKNLKAFISASAIGYYGAITSDRIFNEKDIPADDFLGQTCSQWEQMTDRFKDLGTRTAPRHSGNLRFY